MSKANWAGGASGALSGAATGATVAGPWGAAIGGAIGGAAGLFGRRKAKKKSTFDKRQRLLNQQQHDSILGKGPLADLYSYNPDQANSVFDKTIANPAYRNFKEKLAPEITGQFRKNGLQNSSYAGDALSKLARDIQEGLDGKRSEYMYNQENNAKNAKRNAIENLQNRTTFDYDTNNSSGFNINSILSSFTPEITSGLSSYFGQDSNNLEPQKLSRGGGFSGSNGLTPQQIGIR